MTEGERILGDELEAMRLRLEDVTADRDRWKAECEKLGRRLGRARKRERPDGTVVIKPTILRYHGHPITAEVRCYEKGDIASIDVYDGCGNRLQHVFDRGGDHISSHQWLNEPAAPRRVRFVSDGGAS